MMLIIIIIIIAKPPDVLLPWLHLLPGEWSANCQETHDDVEGLSLMPVCHKQFTISGRGG